MGEPTCMHKENKQRIQGGGVGWSEESFDWSIPAIGENIYSGIAKLLYKGVQWFSIGLCLGLGLSTGYFLFMLILSLV
jgi:hypothetical protein